MSETDLVRSYETLCEDAQATIPEIAVETCRDAVARGDLLLIDVREAEEWIDGIIPQATTISRGVLEKEIQATAEDRATPICLYCSSGRRSLLAAMSLRTMGYTDVRSLAGGVTAWRDADEDIAPGPTDTLVASTADGAEHCDPECWESIRRSFAITTQRVRVLDGTTVPLTYFDHAATTHPPDLVIDRVREFLRHEYANVHRATYQLARRSTLRFEDCYRTCRRFVGATASEHCVVFTPNTTAGLELVAHVTASLPGKVLVTDLEHHSGDLPYRRRGDVVRIGLDDDLRLDLAALRDTLRTERIKLVSVTGAANVTGWMPPLTEIATLAHEAGALICVDAAQLLAHAPIDMGTPGEPGSIDFLVAAGHKAYAPFGAGFLVGPQSLLDASEPVIPGGGVASRVDEETASWLPSPDRHQYGTPNVGGVVGMSEMLTFLDRIGMDRVREHEMRLFRRLVDGLLSVDGVELYGPASLDERVGIVPFNIRGREDMLTAAILGEEFGIAVRNGRFCAHVHSRRVLPDAGPEGAVRASIGLYNDESDVDRLVTAVEAIRAGRFKGRYSERGEAVSGEWGGRCADRWMEGRSEAPDDA